jgi:hypothetical protein
VARQSDTSLHLQKARDRLIALRARVETLEIDVRGSVLGTLDCILTSRELPAEIDDGIAKLSGN